MPSKYRHLAFVCAGAALLCFGCAGDRTAANGPAPQALAFPAPSALEGREASWSGGFIPPAEYDAQGYPNNRVVDYLGKDCVGFRAFLDSTGSLNAYGYCIYSTEASGDNMSLSLYWSTPPPAGTFYYGLANFSTDSWDWFTLPGDSENIAVSNVADHIDGSGHALLALMQTGTPDGELTSSELDAIRLESGPPANGWVYTVASQFTIPGTSYAHLSDLVEHNGKPALAYSVSDENQSYEVHCLYSNTATADVPADWDTADLLTGSVRLHDSLASIGGELYYAAFTDNDSLLHVKHATDPAGTWSEETADSTGFETLPEEILLGDLAGKAVISFHVGPDPDLVDASDWLGYGYQDQQQAWKLALVKRLDWQGNLTNFTKPLDLHGEPLILYGYSEAPDGYGLYCSTTALSEPASESDWTAERIATAQFDDFRLGLAGGMLGTSPCACATYTQFVDPPTITLFRLNGLDPAAANWDSHVIDYFNFDSIVDHTFAVIDGMPAVLNSSYDYNQDPTAYRLDLYTSLSAMPSGEQDWTLSIPSFDAGSGTVRLAQINGWPAVLFKQTLVDFNGDQHIKIVYGHYAP